jgi:uncharacterized protein (TIGR03435 family)
VMARGASQLLADRFHAANSVPERVMCLCRPLLLRNEGGEGRAFAAPECLTQADRTPNPGTRCGAEVSAVSATQAGRGGTVKDCPSLRLSPRSFVTGREGKPHPTTFTAVIQKRRCARWRVTYAGKFRWNWKTGMTPINKVPVVLLALVIFKSAAFASANNRGPRIGEAPPPLALASTLQGPPLQAISWDKLKGKVVVLEFWSTWCGPCIATIPHLNELADQFGNRPVVFISVTDENPDYVRDFLKMKPMTGWIAVDGPLAATRTAFNAAGIPHTVIVDRAGKIAAITHPAKLMAKHLEEVLAGKPCSLPAPEPDFDDQDTEKVPVSMPALKIVEVSISGPFPQPKGAFNFCSWDESHAQFTAKKALLRSALAGCFRIDESFVIPNPAMPGGLYDITVSGPSNRVAAIQSQFAAAFQTAFGLSVRTNCREMQVYTMTLLETNAPNLKPVHKRGGGGEQTGGFTLSGSEMDSIAFFLGHLLYKPVLNETQSTNLWAADLKWEMSAAERLDSKIRAQAGRDWFHKLCDDPSTAPDTEALQVARAKLGPEDFEVLQTELGKPATQRFKRESVRIIKAAREQLGLELVLTNRMVPVLELTKSE